jgi:putative hydrolase of the HAD superfamily
MVSLTHDLERGRATQFDWNRRMGQALGIDSTNLLGRIFADSRLDESMVSVLARARDCGLRIGLLSNSMGLAPWNMYRGFDIDAAFDVALISGQHGLRKPEPAVYELILKMLEVPGEECVFIDDNAVNLPPAGALGMATVLHRSAEHSTTRLGELLGVEGAVRFELEGEPERVIEAGGTFWEPGGDVIHYQDGNALGDTRTRFVVTMMCAPGKPMLELVSERELAERAQLRAPRPTD